MAHKHIRFLSLLILSAFAGPASCDWSGEWSMDARGVVQNLGPGPNPTTGMVPYAPSLSVLIISAATQMVRFPRELSTSQGLRA
jgi:hypothetical protein